MANSIQVINSSKEQPISLKKETSSWNNRTVQVASLVSYAGLVGGTIAASLLGGPIALITGLAVAAFLALATFIRSVSPQPKIKTATPQPKQDPIPEPVKQTIEIAAEPVVTTKPTAPQPNHLKNALVLTGKSTAQGAKAALYGFVAFEMSSFALGLGLGGLSAAHMVVDSGNPGIGIVAGAVCLALAAKVGHIAVKIGSSAIRSGVSSAKTGAQAAVSSFKYAKQHPYKAALGVAAGAACVAYGANAAYRIYTAPPLLALGTPADAARALVKVS